MKFVYVVDNIDWEEKVHDIREQHQNKSVYAVGTSMVFSRISSDHLPDDGSQMDVKTCNFVEVVRVTNDEMDRIQTRYKIFVARIMIERFPEFFNLRQYLLDKLALSHKNSAATGKIISHNTYSADEEREKIQ